MQNVGKLVFFRCLVIFALGRVPNFQRLIQSVDLYTKENLRPSTGTTGIGGQRMMVLAVQGLERNFEFTQILKYSKIIKKGIIR